MKIVHASDWHGNIFKLPWADVYVFTGDMLPNFCFAQYLVGGAKVKTYQANMHLFGESNDAPFNAHFVRRIVDHNEEKKCQLRWINECAGDYKRILGNPSAQVICVRGNHDFIDLKHAFSCDVWEVKLDSSRWISIDGIKFGGLRGIPVMVNEWSDEFDEATFSDNASKLPHDLDVLITHCPPRGILDYSGHSHGSIPLSSYINKRNFTDKKLKAHFFGHNHSAPGIKIENETIFSNAAEKYHTIVI